MKRAAGVAASIWGGGREGGLLLGGWWWRITRTAVGEVCLSDAQLSTNRASPTLNTKKKPHVYFVPFTNSFVRLSN